MTPEQKQAHLFGALLEALGAINAVTTPLAILSSVVPPHEAEAFKKGMDDFHSRITKALTEMEKYTNG